MKNQIKTVLFLGLLTGLLMVVGNLVGGISGLFIGLVFAIGMNFFSYFFSHKIVLAMYRAKEVQESDAPRLYKLVKEVSSLANVPMPKVYIINKPSPNAFATGRNPKNAAVAFTTGILDLLKDDELKGVIAHEIAHVKNRDILIATIAATIAGVISYVAFMARWAAIFGGFGGRDNDNKGGGILELLVLAIVTPLIATIIQLAISRSREYLADESAAKTVHSPFGLASALEKLEGGINSRPMMDANKATASLFIASPFRGGGFLKLFSTHPPIKDRVNRLKSMSI